MAQYDYNGLQIEVPQDWQDRSTIVLRAAEKIDDFRFNVVLMQRLFKHKSLNEAASQVRDELRTQQIPGLKLYDIQEVEAGGLSWLDFDMEHDVPLSAGLRPKIMRVRRRHMMTSKETLLYELLATNIVSQFEAQAHLIDEIRASVVLP